MVYPYDGGYDIWTGLRRVQGEVRVVVVRHPIGRGSDSEGRSTGPGGGDHSVGT